MSKKKLCKETRKKQKFLVWFTIIIAGINFYWLLVLLCTFIFGLRRIKNKNLLKTINFSLTS
tara:strand:- start:245 stop:430 length:186 start_codon:yes stop_codon:yes gene_type:complete